MNVIGNISRNSKSNAIFEQPPFHLSPVLLPGHCWVGHQVLVLIGQLIPLYPLLLTLLFQFVYYLFEDVLYEGQSVYPAVVAVALNRHILTPPQLNLQLLSLQHPIQLCQFLPQHLPQRQSRASRVKHNQLTFGLSPFEPAIFEAAQQPVRPTAVFSVNRYHQVLGAAWKQLQPLQRPEYDLIVVAHQHGRHVHIHHFNVLQVLLLVYFSSRRIHLAHFSEVTVQKGLGEEVNGSCSEPAAGQHGFVVFAVEGAGLVGVGGINGEGNDLVFEELVESRLGKGWLLLRLHIILYRL